MRDQEFLNHEPNGREDFELQSQERLPSTQTSHGRVRSVQPSY